MIKFCGEISEAVKKQVMRQQAEFFFWVFLVNVILFSVPFIYLAITYLWVFISLPVCFLAIPFGQLIIRPDKKMYGKMFPDVVTIEEEQMTAEGKELFQTRDMADVKKVIDYGEYYFIVFYFPAKSQQFICEKDLLVSGTIEDFEDLFSGKIVCKKTKVKTAG